MARYSHPLIRVTIAAAFCCVVPAAHAGKEHHHGDGNSITVRWFSQQYGKSSAAAGADIDVRRKTPGHRAQQTDPTGHVAVHVKNGSGASSSVVIGGATDAPPQQPLYPPLPSSSPRLKQTQPAGPGSFWYQDGAGHVCMYAPNSVLPCFTITGGGDPGATAPPLTPATIAAHVADRMALSPGQVNASPSQAGLTGAASWFWLDPAPTTQQLSLTLAGEAVTVTAVPEVSWRFGDGATLDGRAGVPYQPGAVPSTAITHVYNTRCLPGDQGHDPYVLTSCGINGYPLAATVTWQISYRAAGPVAATGTLPTRTTTSSAAYPVSEARAFLVQGTAR